MVTKLIAKADCIAEDVKAGFMKLHQKAENNRGAEMLEIALVVVVVLGIYAAFKKLQSAVSGSLNNATEKVTQGAK